MTKKKKVSDRNKKKNVGGRPVALEPDVRTIAIIQGLGEIQATVEECAAVMGVGKATFLRFLERNPSVEESYERAKEQGKSSLRRHQFKVAAKGNPTMLIWLGKQYLEQADKSEMRHGETTKKPLRLTLSDEQLLAIASGKA